MWSLIAALLSAIVELVKFAARKNEKPAKTTDVPKVDRVGEELEAARRRALRQQKPN